MQLKQIVFKRAANKLPKWAFLQRTLIELMNEAVELVLDKYLRPDGEFMWPTSEDHVSPDGLDDAYESFHSWPLFYLLGGSEKFLDLAKRQFGAITRQFSRYDCGAGHPVVVKEYEQSYDWMHQGEGYLFFYLLNLADPQDDNNKKRALNFAAFYLNEDDSIPEYNYDPVHKVLKSAYLGSMGPGYHNFGPAWSYAPYMDNYGLPFYDVPQVQTVLDLKDKAKAMSMGDIRRARLSKSDTVINLIATSMVMNAYLHTGEDKYKEWILQYSGAWRQRCQENGGLMPDNCGPSGKVGELIEGRWYGGHYGWTFPHGFHFISDALTVAGENECLLTGDPHRLLWVREQTEKLLEQAVEKDGQLLVPQKYAQDGSVIEYCILPENDFTRPDRVTTRPDFSRKLQVNGWFEFKPLLATGLIHTYLASFDDKSREILAATQPKTKEKLSKRYSKYLGGQDRAYFSYLTGVYAEYPEDVLWHSLDQVYTRVQMMLEDKQDPASYNDDYLQRRNPITTEALVNLTLGGPMPIYNGGLLMVSVRYFDLELKRPGLPPEVAALVSSVEKDKISLTLCNLHPYQKRQLGLLGGAFGEHRIKKVSYTSEGSKLIDVAVDDKALTIELAPASVEELEISLERYYYKPSYQTPF